MSDLSRSQNDGGRPAEYLVLFVPLLNKSFPLTVMSGQPPSKNDQVSPQARASGRSRNNTPASSSVEREEQRRRLLTSIMELRNSPSLEAVARQPGMPDRTEYPSHEAWLRALFAAALRQSDETQEYFGHDDDDNKEGGGQYQSESKDSEP